MLVSIGLFLLAFAVLWFSARLVLVSVERLAHTFNISSFAASFFILGLLTSIPELSVGINSIIDKTPQIYVGNLIGGQVLLFLFVIPLLAFLGKGIKLVNELKPKNLLYSFVVILLPTIMTIDRRIDWYEGLIAVIFYLVLFYFIERKQGVVEVLKDALTNEEKKIFLDVVKVIVGIVLIFGASGVIVEQTINLSQFFKISPFLIGILVLAIGTNLPELSLAVRSIISGKKELALGNYVGSASANTLLFGILTITNKASITIQNHFIQTLIFLLLGLGLFFFFTRSKNDLSRKEGLVLLFLYLLFVIFELM